MQLKNCHSRFRGIQPKLIGCPHEFIQKQIDLLNRLSLNEKTAPNTLPSKPWRQILGVLNSQHLRQPSTLGDPLKPAQGKKAGTQIPNQRHPACFSAAILPSSKKQQQFNDRHWSAKRAWKDSRNKPGNSEGGGIASFGRVDKLEERRLEKAALPSSWHNEAGTCRLRRVFFNRLACKCPVMIAPSMPHS